MSNLQDANLDDEEILKYQRTVQTLMAHPSEGEEIVISGISGCFPSSNNVHEFRDNLFNKMDMVQPNIRWEYTHTELPLRSGSIPEVNKYDAGYFGVHTRQIDSLDVMNRLLQERTIEAILDAGLQPSYFENTRTGVFVGSCVSENEKTWFLDNDKPHYYPLTGTMKSMLAHRIGYFLKVKGPGFAADTACSSSLFALENAYRAIRMGEIDNAIVAGTNLCLHPFMTMQFYRIGVLCRDGVCKCFDADANGYVRSEAVVVMILQKSKCAKRVYARAVHVASNCDGFKEQGITFPSSAMQTELLTRFYEECGVDPSSLSFLEAHGTGTAVGDPEESMAIDNVFAKNRKTPLLMGSSKSNIGHSEPTSGLCSIVKCVLAMETGLIAPNINFKRPNEAIRVLVEKRAKLVLETTPLEDDRGLMAVNNFGFGGGNCHVLLRWNPKAKINNGLPDDDIPRLVCVSGRTPEAVECLLDSVAQNDLDAEFVGLLHESFSKGIRNHLYRGYTIASKTGEVSRSLKYYPGLSKPLVISLGELNDWHHIGKKLLDFSAFSAFMQRIKKLLPSEYVNICDKLFDNKYAENKDAQVLGAIVVQMGIVDIFSSIDIKPKTYTGILLGEILSSYYNGLLSLEETINRALSRKVTHSDKHKEKSYKTPEANNSVNGNFKKSTSSGSDDGVTTNGYNSYENNLNGGIHGGTKGLDPNPIILEIGKWQTCNWKNSHTLRLFHEENEDCIDELLECVGRLYELGYNPQINRLYPPVQFPVSRGTRMISPYIKWKHTKSHFVQKFSNEQLMFSQRGVKHYKIDFRDPEIAYIAGHVIDGRNLFPATGYLYLVWDTFSLIKRESIENVHVIFENCKFIRATTIHPQGTLDLHVTIHLGSGNFEVSEGNATLVLGRIAILNENEKGYKIPDLDKPVEDCMMSLNSKDIYKEFRLRGYNYSGAFRAIESANVDATNGLIRWEGNWVSFLDNMLQLKILQLDSRLLYVPVFISRISICGSTHLDMIKTDFIDKEEAPILPVRCDDVTGTIRCGNVVISGLLATSIPRKKNLGVPVLERYEFVPNSAELSADQSVRINLQIILENSLMYQVKAIEVVDEFTKQGTQPLASIIQSVLEAQPLVQQSIKIFSKRPIDTSVTVEDKELKLETNCLLVIASNVSKRKDLLSQAFIALREDGYIISRESGDFLENSDLNILTSHKTAEETILLLQRRNNIAAPIFIRVTSTGDFSWLPRLQEDLKKGRDVVLYAENEPTSGIVGLTNCLRREPESKSVRCVFLMDEAKTFQPMHPYFANQLEKNMAVNIYKDGQWGTYRHLEINKENYEQREHCFVNVTQRGDLSSLRWMGGPLSRQMELEPEKTLVHVYYAALNFRDIMTATGKITADVITKNRMEQECVQGIEFSGRDSRGRRLMGMVNCGALSSLVLADTYMCFAIPAWWSMEEAATVPAVYGTVIYALVIRGRMKKGESILIHSGSGGVGQAAICVCLFYGCQVFTTVGTAEKREFLKKMFPCLTDEHIGDSHDESFEQMIFKETKGKGVDMVLNSLAEEKLVASVRCLARGGRLLEIGKYDLANNTQLSTILFQKEASYQGVMLDQFFNDIPERKKEVSAALSRALTAGAVKPLGRNIFKYEEIEQAFRFMSTGKHMGKVLVQIRDAEKELVSVPPPRTFPGLARYLCCPERTYVVIGGLGGFGLELCDWLVLRGARKLVITSRKGISTGYQDMRISIWKSYGVVVEVSTASVTTKEGCETLIKDCLKLGRIGAIFNLAVVLEDAIFENQTQDSFVKSFGPKATATTYLDAFTRDLCPDLSDFVIFSSVSCGRGNAGQTNYGMANSVMERICENRKRDGYPALAIEWGAVGEVGLVADMLEENTEIEIGGTLQQKISSCLQVMDNFLTQKDAAIVSSMVVAEKKGAGGADNIVDAVINILGVTDSTSVSMHSTLSELGMDSMTGVEIKQVLEREFDVYLSPKEIRTLTLGRLKEIQEEKNDEEQSTQQPSEEKLELDMLFKRITIKSDITAPYVRFETKIKEGSLGPKVLFIPGVDGCTNTLEVLASNIKGHGICLQYPTQPLSTRETAECLTARIEELVPKTEPLIIVPYSFGTLIALEIVHSLATKGYKGTIISLDGAPLHTYKLMQTLNTSSGQVFQTDLVCRLVSVITGGVSPHQKVEIAKCETWEEKLDRALELAKSDLGDHMDRLKIICNCIFWRTQALMEYTPSYNQVEWDIKLYKTRRNDMGLDEDYGLSKIFGKAIDVVAVKGTHFTFLDDPQLADALNADIEKWSKL